MAKVTYENEIAAPLVIDPYNDFISGGKTWQIPFWSLARRAAWVQ